MKPKTTAPITVVCLAFGLLVFLSANTLTAQAQQVQVTAADPAAAAQGTINLNVKVTGKGFKNGAKAKWFITGTTDPGGVQVNSTTFVNAGEVTANITVADTAIIANFDIQVLNSDGRGGKGTELFAVTPKGGGSASCPALTPAPIGDTKCYAALPGCLDITFGTNGLVVTDPSVLSIGGNHAYGVLIQTDGKILVTGATNGGLNASGDFVVLRYQTGGSLDTTFGDPDPLNPPLRLGYVRTLFTSGVDQGFASILQPDGKIVVAGTANGVWAVARYNIDGTLDPTFASGGKETLPPGNGVNSMAIQSDGKLVLVGGGNFTIMRLNQDGSPDASFGTGGTVIANPSSVKRGSSGAISVAIQRIPAVSGEERIVVGGWADANLTTGSSAVHVFTLMRFRPNGVIDTTFGSSGRAATNFFGFGDEIRVIAIDQANRIVGAGVTNTASSSCGSYVSDFAVARFTQDGAADISFSGDGKVSTDASSGGNQANGLLLQPDGKVLITGTANIGTSLAFALVRYNGDGTPDSSFGILGTGVVTTDFGPEEDVPSAIAQQPWDGKIVVAGYARFGHLYIALARYWQ
jgi:uncharacterized delta-60 repeat protein